MARGAGGTRENGVSSSSAMPTSVEAVIEQVREAHDRGTPLRVVGSGTWLDAGRPCTATAALHLGTVRGIIAYEPGDLTLTALGGTTLAEIESATAAEGQWLTLDPFGAPNGTLGATVASSSWGPLASAFGTPRDHVLGCEFVTGAGDLVRAGGRVVKNVAGFDLVRLVTGAWGTLGALTEITVRLRARPELDRTLIVTIDDSSPSDVAHTGWRWLRASDFTPLAAELLSPALSAALGLERRSCLAVRLGGNEAYVHAATEALAQVGELREAPVELWPTLAQSEPVAAMTLRLSALPSRAGVLWDHAVTLAERHGGAAHATLVRGVVRCILPANDDLTLFNELSRSMATPPEGITMVGERLPAALWPVLDRDRSIATLSDRVRDAFDPAHIMNPATVGAAT